MMIASALLAVILAVDAGEPAPHPGDDEARIEALVAAERAQSAAIAAQADQTKAEAEELAREHAAEQFPPPSGTVITFDDVAKMKGRGVRVRTVSGRVQAGIVEEAGKGELRLRAPMRGGYAEFTLARKQIATIEAQ